MKSIVKIIILSAICLSSQLYAADNNTMLSPMGNLPVVKNTTASSLSLYAESKLYPNVIWNNNSTDSVMNLSSKENLASSKLLVFNSMKNSKANSNSFQSKVSSIISAADPMPDATIYSSGETTIVNGVAVFKECYSATGAFIFTNGSTTSTTNTNYTVDWGDGSPVLTFPTWSTISHNYAVGKWVLKYTVTGITADKATTKNYEIYVGSKPAISMGSPGLTDNCSAFPIFFPITGTEKNPSDTKYTVTFNDGTAPITYDPSAGNGGITHTFAKSSCGTTSYSGNTAYPNSFSASVVAVNTCGVSAVSVVPIYVSTSPVVDFSMAVSKTALNSQVCLTNATTGFVSDGANCSAVPKLVWKITPATGFTLGSGEILGDDFGLDNSNLWKPGSNKICPTFTKPGTYTITLRVDTKRCGESVKTKTICIESPLVPKFDLDVNIGCAPLSVSTTNTTDLSKTCSATYLWSVSYSPENCGSGSGVWNFTNGTSATSENPSFNFVTSGIYKIKLSATNTAGTFSFEKAVSVQKPPTVSINKILDFCGTASVQASALVNSCSTSTTAMTYLWEFPGGSPSSSTLAVPEIVTYNALGDYSVKLTVTNECGSTTTTSNTFKVNPIPAVNAVENQLYCNGVVSNEIIFGGSANTYYEWKNDNPSIGLAASGSGNISPFTLRNSGNKVLTAKITVTPKMFTTNCPGPSTTFTISVNPSGDVAQPINQVVVNGASTSNVSFGTSNIDGTTTYAWTNDKPEIGLGESGNGNIGAFTAINETEAPIIATLSVTPTYTNGSVSCQGPAKYFTIIVNPTAKMNKPDNIELCNGFETQNIVFTTNVTGGITTYTWKNKIPSIGLPASGEGNINSFVAVNTGVVSKTATITVTPTFSYGGISTVGVPVTFTIKINPAPVVIRQPKSSFVCPGGYADSLIVKYADGVGAATYQWYSNNTNANSGGTEIVGANSDSYVPSTTTPGTTYYYCVVSSAGGVCSSVTSQTATVSVNDAAIISEQPTALQNLCVGGTIATPLSIKYVGGNGTPKYQWYKSTDNSYNSGVQISGAVDSVYTPPVYLNSGSYYYYVNLTTSGDGCGSTVSSIAKVEVFNDPIIVDQPISTQTLCQNTTPTDLIVSASGGLGTYSYQWYQNTVNNNTTGVKISEANSNIYSPSTALTGTTYYYCEITQINGLACGVTSMTAAVNVNAVPKITSQPISSTICYGDVPKALFVSYSYGVGNPTYQWYSNSTNSTSTGTLIPDATSAKYQPTVSGLGTTYYYCFISNFTGACNSLMTETAFVTVNPTPSVSSESTTICSGTAFSVLPDESKGNVIPEGTTYIWSNPVISPANSISGAIAQSIPVSEIGQQLINTTNNLATATYTVTPISGSCLGATFKVVVNVIAPIKPNAIVTNSSCFGANNASIITHITGGKPFLSGDSLKIAWVGPNGFTANTKNITGLLPGEYTLTINDAGGCPFTADYLITEPAEIIVNSDVVKNNDCYGDANGAISISVTGGVPAYKFVWTKNGLPFATTEDISNLTAGKYVVTVSDANNCKTKEVGFTITESPLLTISLLNHKDITCFGDANGEINIDVQGGSPIELSTGVFGYKYAWTNSNGFISDSQNLSNIPAGTYNLTVTDNYDCTKTFSIVLTEPTELKLTTETTNVTCYGSNNGSITAIISGGVSPYKIQWSNLGSGTKQSDLQPGNYTVTVTDANLCQKTVSVNISEANFSYHPTFKNVSCYGAKDGSINLGITGGIAPISVKWSDNPTAGEVRNNLAPGVYTVTLNDAAPCYITESFLIQSPTQIAITAKITNAFNCSNPNTGAINVSIEGGTPPYKCEWLNGDTTRNITNITSGKYVIKVVDAKGCTQSAQFEVLRQQPMVVSVSSKINFNCATKKLSLQYNAMVSGGIAPYNYVWSGGAVSGANNEMMETSQNSVVVLQATDALGCVASYAFNVEIPTFGIDSKLVDCSKSSYQFNAIEVYVEGTKYSYNWDFGDGKSATQKNVIHNYSAAGDYTVRLTMSNGNCETTFEKKITVEPLPELVLDRDLKICRGELNVFHVSGANSYKWSDGTNSDSIVIKQEGSYSVIGSTKNGCSQTLSFTVKYYDSFNYTLQSDKSEVAANSTVRFWSESIPYSRYYWDFGDGTSDEGNDLTHTFGVSPEGYFDVKLRIVNPNGCTELASKRIWLTTPELPNTFTPNGDGVNDEFLKGWDIKLYNRNGILLYEGKDGWNGVYKGKVVSNGTYFYVLNYPVLDGVKTKTGFVKLVR